MTALYHAPDWGCEGCPFYGDGLDVCQAVRRDGEPDGRPIGSVAATSPDNPSPPAPEWCPIRGGWVTVRPPLVRTFDWQELRYPGSSGAFPAKSLTLVDADGTETEAEPIGDGRYRLPSGRVLVLKRSAAGSIALWEEP